MEDGPLEMARDLITAVAFGVLTLVEVAVGVAILVVPAWMAVSVVMWVAN